MTLSFDIRSAALTDIPQLLSVGRSCFDEMRFDEEGNNWEDEAVEEWMTQVINDKDNFITLLAHTGDRILGYFAVVLTRRHAWHRGPKHAAELAWHARTDLDLISKCRVLFSLLDCMESLIRMKDIKWFHMGCSGKPEFKAVHDYLQRRGYVDTDIVMAKEL